MSYKGRYLPSYPKKYNGNTKNIVYRSLWERTFMKYCDLTESVKEWQSEEFFIPYVSPVDKRIHRYFPDFWVKKRNSTGIIEQVVIEVKPQKHIDPPKVQKRKTRRYMGEMARHAVNMRKFEVAERFCSDRGMKFQLMTEKELNIK